MTTIFTPRHAIERVLVGSTQVKKFTFYETRLQQILFWLAMVLLIGGIACGVIAYFVNGSDIAPIGMVLILAAEVAFLGCSIAQLIPELMKLRDPERDFIAPYAERFNDEIDLIGDLVSSHHSQHLAYAANSFSLLAEQLKARISLLVGAIDKVGVIPLGVTTYISWAKIPKEIEVFGRAEWVLAVLILLYLLALRMNLVAQWLERRAVIFQIAAEQKKKCEVN